MIFDFWFLVFDLYFFFLMSARYEPEWFMKSHHMSPREAVQTHVDVRAKKSIAMHWGTFVFTDERIPPSHFVSFLSSCRLASVSL